MDELCLSALGNLRGSHCLITGATGFIGGRLVEYLGLDDSIKVTLPMRSYANAARVSRFRATRVRLDLCSYSQLSTVMGDVDYVFHCMHDFSNEEFNLIATKSIARACLETKVKRLVYLSSFAVHHPFSARELSEHTDFADSSWPYTNSKRAIENVLLDSYREGLPVVILRPTIVYGPFSKQWVDGSAMLLRNCKISLPQSGQGLCHALYIDDLVEVMLVAAVDSQAVGKVFLISGPEPICWQHFYSAFESALGLQSRILSDGSGSKTAPEELPLITRLWNMVEAPGLKPVAKAVVSVLKIQNAKRIKHGVLAPIYQFRGPMHDIHNTTARISLESLTKTLRYFPRFDFDTGFEQVRHYLDWRRA